MNITPLAIDGAYLISAQKHQDDRGEFMRLFCQPSLHKILSGEQIIQMNLSMTHETGAIRGMHYQLPPHAETKLVRCLQGEVFDVVVDLRQGSTTFLQWHAEVLNPDTAHMLLIPKGCAHGFQVLKPNSQLLYAHTQAYMPQAEAGVRFDDPLLGIDWPVSMTMVSDRDRPHVLLSTHYQGIVL